MSISIFNLHILFSFTRSRRIAENRDSECLNESGTVNAHNAHNLMRLGPETVWDRFKDGIFRRRPGIGRRGKLPFSLIIYIQD